LLYPLFATPHAGAKACAARAPALLAPEKLRKEAEKLESDLEEEKRLNRKSSLRNKNMK